jgi:putative ABC transport system permease protein
MDTLLQDLRFALRSLVRNPGVFSIAVLSLALGVAANTTVFSGADAFLYRPLPWPEGERMLQVWTTNEERGWTEASSSMPDYVDWRAESRNVDLAAYTFTSFDVSGGEQPERVSGVRVGDGFFGVVGEGPETGRGFRADEERAGNDVVVLSRRFAERRFPGESALDRTLVVDGRPHLVIGVLPADFNFPDDRGDIHAPLGRTGEEPRESRYLRIIGRLRGGASVESAQAELSALTARLAAAHPRENLGMGVRVVPLKAALFDADFWTAAMICTVAVAFVLLIACANIANLLLARASAREREIAVRTVLGAGRLRVLRQLLTESMVLALAGGVLGAILSVWGIRWLVSLMPVDFQFVDRITLSGRALAFTLGVTMLSGILFGLAPALQALRPDLNTSLREAGGRGSTLGARRGRLRGALVVAEIALALVLLVSAGLLVRGYFGLRSVEPGFETRDVLTARITLPQARYPDSLQVTQFHLRLLERLRAVPGVSAVGATSILPLSGGSGTYYETEDQPAPDPARRAVVQFRRVLPGYFETLRIPLRAGRALGEGDRAGGVPVMLVNEAFASQHWPGTSALGRRVVLSSGPCEIVGVVADSRDFGRDDEASPMIFLPALDRGDRTLSFVMRREGDPAALADALRAEVSALDPELPIYQIATMTEILDREGQGDLIMVRLLTVFAVVALVMALMGVYGVMAYNVAQRTQEVGIRMALGARTDDIVGLIVRRGVLLAGLGLAAGLLLALATARFLAAFLFGLSPFDLPTFAAITAALGVAALVACYVPARRAARVDPIVALRVE